MATKPLSSTLPRWANTVAGDPSKVSEPASGKKDIGWIVGEKPPAQWKNWLLLQCYNWLVWLDAFETEAHTWTITQTFGGGISASNSTLNTRAIYGIGNGTAEGIKGVGGPGGNGIVGEASGAGTYALYGKGTALGVIGVRGEGGSGSVGGSFVGGGVSAGVSATAGSGGGNGVNALGILTGAGGSFQGGLTGDGVQGTGGATSGRGGTLVGGGTSGIGLHVTGGAPDGNAITAIAVGAGLAVAATGAISTNDSVYADVVCRAGTTSTNTMRGTYSEFGGTITHPASNVTIKHQVRPINTIRAWAMITTDGAGAITLEDGAGISGVAINGNSIEITFVDAFATNKYACFASGCDGSVAVGTPKFAIYQPNNTTTLAIVLTGSNPATTVLSLDFMAIGRQ
jgi:hypothetical protein